MNNKRRLLWQLPFLAFLVIGTVIIVSRQQSTPYQHDRGMVFGTVYHITYQSSKSLQKDIEAELAKVDASLSPFNERSIITAVNENRDTVVNKMFSDVFALAMKISDSTNGAFDITVASLVNAWGFGFKGGAMPSRHQVDSLKALVGYHKVSLTNGRVSKADPRIMLDCSSIAKGYGCDVVAKFLSAKGIDNYMVEIGGEIVTRGISEKRLPWKIGVTKPTDDSLNVNQEIQTIINVTDKAMATSGNYRNFYYKNGRKYAHTIDPSTGYPVQHNILSSTVIADDCATADAYATAFMVMGLDKAKTILSRHPELMAYFILASDDGTNKVWFSPSMKDKIAK